MEGSGNDTMHYVLSDHLGSLTGIVNATTSAVTKYSFNAWGIPRDASDWTKPDTSYLFAGRGFTGHEHLTDFNLINMNGRVYNPILGRFLSPDPYVQAPDYPNNFNRYAYALNNPLIYTDPDGELFIIDDWIIGFAKGLFNKDESAWKSANRHAKNSAKIWGGLFTSNDNKNFFGRSWEILSRLTWQLPQTTVGFLGAHGTNMIGNVENIDYYDGATVIQTRKGGYWGITLGSYITGSNFIRPDSKNSLFQHEYGHYIQSQKSGWFYLSKYGIPSALSKKYTDHSFHPAEQDANIQAFRYFSKYENGFNWMDKYGTQRSHWNSAYNPINGYNWRLAYTNPLNQAALEDGRLKLSWYDYLMAPFNFTFIGTIIPGLTNAIILNQQY
jgi:RHS repeat-associated protein